MAPRLDYAAYTIGWVCALPIELAAAQALLDEEHEDLPRVDDNTYTLGSFGKHNVVIACLPAGRMGTTSAATVVTQMRTTFPKVRFGLMVGIGGGVPTTADVRLGDVVVSLPERGHGGVVQYDFGKTHPDRFEQTGSLNSPPPILLTAVAKLRACHELGKYRFHGFMADLERFPKFRLENAGPDRLFNDASNGSSKSEDGRPSRGDNTSVVRHGASIPGSSKSEEVDSPIRGNSTPVVHHDATALGSSNSKELESPSRGDDVPVVHHGTIASGSSKCQEVERPIRGDDGPVVHYGTIASGNQVMKDGQKRDEISKKFGGVLCFEMEAAGLMDTFPCLVIRGICDYCDSHKSKGWQPYAAAVAAAWAKDLLGYVAPPSEQAVAVVGKIVSRVAEQDSWITSFASNLVLKKTDDAETRARELIQRISGHDHARACHHFQARQFPGTTLWILKHEAFLAWLESPNRSILLLKGKIGSGKTFVAASAVQHLIADCGTTDAVLYYFAEGAHHTPLDIFRSLTRQLLDILAARSISCSQTIVKALEVEFGHVNQISDPITLVHTILTPLMREFKTTTICFDGIEMYDEHNRQQVLEGFAKLEARLFFTCRDTVSLREMLHRRPNSISLDDGTNSVDIESYIDEQLQRLSSTSDLFYDDTVRHGVKQELMKKADGMFLWVCLQLEIIKSCNTAAEAFRTIANLPSQLQLVFERCLLQKHRGRPVCEPKVLRWVTAALEPLTVPVLSEMLIPASGTEYETRSGVSIIRAGASLIVIQDQVLTPIHHSIKQWLFSKDLQDLLLPGGSLEDLAYRDLASTEAETVLEIASLSLRYIQENCIGAVAVKPRAKLPTMADQIPSPIRRLLHMGKPDQLHLVSLPLPPRHRRPRTMNTALLNYAIRSWPVHTAHITSSHRAWECFRTVALSYDMLQVVHPWTTEDSRRLQTTNTHVRGLLGYAIAKGHEPLLTLTLEPVLLLPRETYTYYLPGNDLLPPLHVASQAGHAKVVERLLPICDINQISDEGHTALYLAVRQSHIDVVTILAAAGAVIDWDLLEHAARIGHSVVVMTLLGVKNMMDIDLYETLLIIAVSHGHSSLVDALIGAGAPVEADLLEAATAQGNYDILTALVVAALITDKRIPGLDRTALKLSLQIGHADIVALLLKRGCPVWTQGEWYAALSMASEKGHGGAVKALLVEMPSNLDSRACVRMALLTDARNGKTKSLSLYLPHITGRCHDDAKDWALCAAASNGHLQIAKLLLDHGAVVNARGRYVQGNHPRIESGYLGRRLQEIDVDRLLGVDACSALWLATISKHVEMVIFLLDRGADVEGVCDSPTPLQIAASVGHPELVKALLDRGADVMSSGGYGNALLLASSEGHVEIMELLLHKIVVDDQSDRSLSLALRETTAHKYIRATRLLLEKGAKSTEDAERLMLYHPLGRTFRGHYR